MLKRRELIKFSPRPRAQSSGYWLHVSRTAMACRFEVTFPFWERAGVNVARDALDEVARLEQQLTVFRETSEVALINRNAASSEVKVEPSLFALLVLCRDLWRETEGAFDITSAPLSRCWGFLKREGRLPDLCEIEQARSLVGSEKMLLNDKSRTISFERSGVEINLGSIGKGYALDHIAAPIRSSVRTALLSAGASSILAIGNGDRRRGGWVVGLRHPRDKKKRLAVLTVRDQAMSTSGSEEQFFEHEGQRFGHIIDPRTGWPSRAVAGVTVIASSAAVADALATAFYVGGPRLAEAYCSTHPDVLVIMLESARSRPVLFGSNNKCEVEIIGE